MEVRTEDIKVGETYNRRYITIGRKRAYMLVKVLAIHTALGHPNVVSGIKVQRVDAPEVIIVTAPTTLETV